MGAIHNDLFSWASKARSKGFDSIEIDLEAAFDLSETLMAMNERIDRLTEALKPFVGVKDQFPETLKLIQPKFSDLTPLTVTVTKGQFINAVRTIAPSKTRAAPTA